MQQGTYNLELLAMPDGTATDLYAGAINIYKCQVSAVNLTCAVSPFINLTHVYGCRPVAAPSHVHPDQHSLAATIPSTGNALLYFANDGGIYRALDGYSGLTTGSCSGINQFDDLNQNLGSMAQFVSFSQHPSDSNTMLGGTQDNGSPATNQATTSLAWTNMLGGDGGYNAIDPLAGANFYASNPDVPPQGLGVQLCTSGVYCKNSSFNFVVTSSGLDGDDGAFYFPYILDPGSSTAMLVGTCRVWRGPRTGGVFTALSPNFDTLGSATCSGGEVNQVRALAAAGTIDQIRPVLRSMLRSHSLAAVYLQKHSALIHSLCSAGTLFRQRSGCHWQRPLSASSLSQVVTRDEPVGSWVVRHSASP